MLFVFPKRSEAAMIDGRPEVFRTCFLYSPKRSDPKGAAMMGRAGTFCRVCGRFVAYFIRCANSLLPVSFDVECWTFFFFIDYSKPWKNFGKPVSGAPRPTAAATTCRRGGPPRSLGESQPTLTPIRGTFYHPRGMVSAHVKWHHSTCEAIPRNQPFV